MSNVKRWLIAAVVCGLGVLPSHAQSIIPVGTYHETFTEVNEDGIPLKYLVTTEILEILVSFDELGHTYRMDTTVTCGVIHDESYNYSIIGKLRIPESVHGFPVEYVGERAFQGCALITSVVLPPSLKDIRNYAFCECRNISGLALSEGLETIRLSAFESCEKLESVWFPSTLQTIESLAFRYCTSLKRVENLNFSSITGVNVFYGCPLTDVNSSSVTGTFPALYAGNVAITSVIIPEGITSLSDRAFFGCSNLRSVTLPATLTAIGYGAFAQCPSLETVEGLDLSISLGRNIFEGCSSLKTVDFSSAKGSIGDLVFAGWDGLEDVLLPEGVTAIGNETFKGCSRLRSIDLPGTLLSVGDGAFSGCASLKRCTVPNLSANMFNDCSELEEVTVTGSQNLIPPAFQGCKALRIVTLPQGANVILENAFLDCCSLETITVPDGVKAIMKGAFSGCASLRMASLPKSMMILEDEVFAGCTSLRAVCSPIAAPFAIPGNCFTAATKAECVLYVPVGTRSLYQTTEGWDFANIVETKVPASMLVCDLNADGVVDVADIASVIGVMSKENGSENPAADVNGDGIVDVADIATVISVMVGQ